MESSNTGRRPSFLKHRLYFYFVYLFELEEEKRKEKSREIKTMSDTQSLTSESSGTTSNSAFLELEDIGKLSLAGAVTRLNLELTYYSALIWKKKLQF